MPATVLIVDDEAPIRAILARWLSAEGYRCLTAGDGAEAWSIVETNHVDLVSSDINMPNVSGIQLLKLITSAHPDLAVLMLSGCGETSTAIQALTLGASGYLLKPVQREELIVQVRQGIERSQLRRERRRHTEELERRVIEQTQMIRAAHEETIHRLVTASSFRDEETGAHIRRTGLFSEALARAAGWSASERELLRMAAPMHDVGKIGIPDAILRKPGRLTSEEFEIMKGHTTIGAQMLEGSSSPMLQLACEIARNHHERWDGSGYPGGLAGLYIPEAARILAVVDVYDALTHDRVYRPAMDEADALDILQQGSGSHFDAGLLALFFTVLEEIRQISDEHPDQAASAGASAASAIVAPAADFPVALAVPTMT